MMNSNKKSIQCELGGRTISLETGRMAKQASGSVLVSYGDTRVLVTSVSSKEPKPGQSFFPLTVDYVEKYYAAGKFPGGFFKREARPSIDATLCSRLIDRPLRPLFPEGYLNDTHVVATVLSVDKENDPEVAASLGASAALMISEAPFAGPVAAVKVGRVDGKLVVNPTIEEFKNSDMELLVAGTQAAVVMVEGSAEEVPEKEVLEAIMFAHKELQPALQMQIDFQKEVGKPKKEFIAPEKDQTAATNVREFAGSRVKDAFNIKDKLDRYSALDAIKAELLEKFIDEEAEDAAEKKAAYEEALGDLKYESMRGMILNDRRRIDGRDMTTVRPIEVEVGVLPKAHGSSLFTRGETQVLSVVTLGTKDDEQMIDSLREDATTKKFLLHYNFPPFSVGEASFLRGPGRREIGHGNLAERSLESFIPNAERFPYTVRIVCETLESNGSSSMGSVCSGSMALMDAGVPMEKPIAGIAMGLIQEDDKTEILTDILGDEDHLGDMDFKVAGTKDGVTAIQMDIKIDGVTEAIMSQALEQAYEGRMHILGEMANAITEARVEISENAPRIISMQVKEEKIREIIGPGGAVIRGMVDEFGVKIDIDDSGLVQIFSTDGSSAAAAKARIESIVEEVEEGKTYKGVVKRIVDFGAFVGITHSSDGLLHISEIAHERVNHVTDYLKEGDELEVLVTEIDRQGKVRLSRKALLEKPANAGGGNGGGNRGGGDRNEKRPRNNNGKPGRFERSGRR